MFSTRMLFGARAPTYTR